jgi:signal peptidase I
MPESSIQNPESVETPSGPETNRAPGRMRIWLRDLIISVVVSFFIITFLYQPVKVEGTSMAPRLRDQDRLFINKFAYEFERIERDDVVVFYYPRDTQKSYIKRVIGLPGDTVRITDGEVFVNGKAIEEPYVPERYRDVRSMDEFRVPEGEYFVMGDHRSISSDSRDFGPVERKLIYGKAAFVYWPREEMGVVR